MVGYSRGRKVYYPSSQMDSSKVEILGLELHFWLNDDCSMFQTEIFAIFQAIQTISSGPTSDSKSCMIFVHSLAMNYTCYQPIAPSGRTFSTFYTHRTRTSTMFVKKSIKMHSEEEEGSCRCFSDFNYTPKEKQDPPNTFFWKML